MSPTVVSMRDLPAAEAMPAATPSSTAATPVSASDRATAAAAPAARSASLALPLILSQLALLAWLGSQAWLLDQERQQLRAARAGLQPTLDNAQRLRRSLDGLATDTQQLADGGHASARLLVDELRRRGITIQVPGAAAAGAAGSTDPAKR